MLPKSAKSKGRRFEQYISNQIEEAGFGKSIRTPGSGSGKIKGDLFNNLPFILEIKNQKAVHFLKDIDQAKRQAAQGNYDPNKWMLVVRDPRTPESSPHVYAVVDFWEILELLKRSSEAIVKTPDKEMKYKLTLLKKIISEILKALE